MKNVLLALALTMAVPTLALADSGGAPNTAQMLQQAQQELGLSNDQTAIMREATQEEMRAHYEITMRYLSRLSDNDKEAMNQEHLEAAKKRQTRLMGMLTPEQQVKATNAFKRHKAEVEKAKAISNTQ